LYEASSPGSPLRRQWDRSPFCVSGAGAGLGIGVVTTFILDYEIAIGFIGGLIVLTVGIGTFRTAVAKAGGNAAPRFASRDLAATFSMAITNPATTIAAAGLFAAFAPVDMYTEPMTANMLVAGVFIGPAVWWLILSSVAGTFRDAFLERGLPHLNHISGVITALSGAGVLIAATIKLRNKPKRFRV